MVFSPHTVIGILSNHGHRIISVVPTTTVAMMIATATRTEGDQTTAVTVPVVVTIFGYGVKPSEMNKPRMCNIAHVLANKLRA